MSPISSNAQFFKEHFIAPAPWQYWQSATEMVISTNVDTNFTVEIRKSDGTYITNVAVSALSPGVFRPSGSFRDFPRHPLNVGVNGAGIFMKGNAPFSVNIRNVASDQLGTDAYIKGNASLTSFGDPGKGLEFRIGYYRDGPLPGERPIYSIMALYDETKIVVNGIEVIILDKGQSYLFRANIGSLVTCSKPCVMNTGAFLDAPSGCGDGTFDQIPPVQVLGERYFVVRTTGNTTSERSTIVSTEDQTWIWIHRYDANGNYVSKDSVLLSSAGSFHTISNGDGRTPLSVAEVSSVKKIAIFSGSAQSCEVDVSTSFPISSPCHGSNYIETTKFKTYRNSDLPYFCYILLENDTAEVLANGTSIETLVGPRKKIGNSGLYMITCNSNNLGNPEVITFTSDVRLHVVIIQIGGGFSMSAAFSNLIEQPKVEDPIFIGSHPCPIQSAILSVSSTYKNYQWYLNGEKIDGATDSIFIATMSGNYHVRALLDCGDDTESAPITITLDSIPQGIMEIDHCGPFEWQDSIYTEDGTYHQLVKTDEGCDSLAILVLDIHEVRSFIQYATACDSFYWKEDDQYYFETGVYSDTLIGQFDCDSIVFLDLTIHVSTKDKSYITTCNPYFWDQTGMFYSKSGTYADTLKNVRGCDSILQLQLSIHGVIENSIWASACDSFLWESNQRVIMESGVYVDTFSSILGCDSVVTLNLLINQGMEEVEAVRSCHPHFWEVTRSYYDSSGLYSAHFSDKNGCDSTRVLHFTRQDSYLFTDTVSALNEYYWPLTGLTYTEAGVYRQEYASKHGCDSVHVLILQIRRRGQVYIPNVFTPNGDRINDRFVIHASPEITQIDELLIFDRWGELVFTQYDFPPNMEEHGWDGFFRGEPLFPGVFTYVAFWDDSEGDPHKQAGDVTILK